MAMGRIVPVRNARLNGWVAWSELGEPAIDGRNAQSAEANALRARPDSTAVDRFCMTARSAYHLLAKPAGAACNLGCQYCFFLSKENLYPARESPLMPDDVLETYIRQLMESSFGPQVEVSWQGGEPMLCGIDFFRRSVALANKYRRPDLRVLHTIQTNGTLIDDEWAKFFKQNGYLVGISIDGPRALHDAYRVTKGADGSFDDVIRGWNYLRKHKVDANILCTIHAANADHPLDVYRFFRDELKAEYIQLIPIVERATPETIALANRGWGGLKGSDRPLYTQTGNLVTDRTAEFAKIGLVAGKDFDASKLDADFAKRIPQVAFDRIMLQIKVNKAVKNLNGWIFDTETGTYGTHYLNRAFIATIGLGANRPKDSVYPMSLKDAEGKDYSGANKYVMHFPKGQLPPAHGFWSLTMYDENVFFVANPLNRYSISPRQNLKSNPDGSIDLYLQSSSPGADIETNWLPAPTGKFKLMLRMYWPNEKSPSILNGTWTIPAVKKVS